MQDTYKKTSRIILLLSVMIIVGVFAWVLISSRNMQKNDLSIDDWKSDFAVYREQGFALSDDIRDKGERTIFLWGPYRFLPKGSYTAAIGYQADEDQDCIAAAAGPDSEFIASSAGILSKYNREIKYQFELGKDIDEFELRFFYNGTGDFIIRSVSIIPNNNQIKRSASQILFLMIFLDIMVLLFLRNRRLWETAVLLLGISLLVSVPMAVKGIHHGHDLQYHFLRIEAILQALRSGQFPARISSIVLYGLGYPLSIYYNDIFLYLPALLRLLGFSVTASYKASVIFVNLLTVIISYYSFSRIFKSQKTALLLTLLYASASYRLVNIFVRAAVGEYTAQAFLPLLALAVYQIFSDTRKTGKGILADAVLLSAAFSGIIGAHILTAVMSVFMMVLTGLFFLKKLIRKQTLLTFAAAAGITLLLNLYFLVPLCDYYFNVPSAMRTGMDSMVSSYIQNKGAFPGMFLGFFQNVIGIDTGDVSVRLQCTPGLPLMIALFAGLLFFYRKKTGRWFLFYLLFSVLTLWLSSDIFPWNVFALHSSVWRMIARIQFPWRFLSFSVLFLTLLSGELAGIIDDTRLLPAFTVSAVLMTFWFTGSYFDQCRIIYVYDTGSVDQASVDTHFFLPGNTLKNFGNALNVTQEGNIREAGMLSRSAGSMKLYCRVSDAGNNENGANLLTVPVFNYKGYQVSDSTGTRYDIINGDQNRIAFELPDGFDGEITVEFKDPASWTLALCISAVSMLCLLFVCGKTTQKKQMI